MPDFRANEFAAMAARLADLLPRLNERDKRIALAVEARSWGYGGITAVYEATGVAKSTISRGIKDLDAGRGSDAPGRVRAAGGGRKKAEVADPGLLDALDSLIEPETRGRPGIWVAVDNQIDPESR